MSENFDSQAKNEKEIEIEIEKEKSSTEEHLESLNPQLWEELSNLPTEQQDERWFSLTQKHLKDYEAGDVESSEFKLEELELLFLNQLGVETMSTLNLEAGQRGFYFDPVKEPGQRMEKLKNVENFLRIVQNEIDKHSKENSSPFQILISGIGISGKATIRNVLTREFSRKEFGKRIISWDRDYQKLFPIPDEWQGDINVVEDVHALDDERDKNGKLKRFDGSDGSPVGYGMVVYVLPTAKTYRQSLIRRGIGWLNIGKLDLTAPNEKEYMQSKEEKIHQTADELERTLEEGGKWFREHLRILRELKNRGIKIMVVEPAEILKQLYNIKDRPELADKSFEEALKILSE
jgi:hypothetical protein